MQYKEMIGWFLSGLLDGLFSRISLLWNALPPGWLEKCVFVVCFYQVAVIELIKVMGVNVKSPLFGNTALIIDICALT